MEGIKTAPTILVMAKFTSCSFIPFATLFAEPDHQYTSSVERDTQDGRHVWIGCVEQHNVLIIVVIG